MQKLRFRLRWYHLGKILSFEIFQFVKNNKIQFYFYFKNSKKSNKKQAKVRREATNCKSVKNNPKN